MFLLEFQTKNNIVRGLLGGDNNKRKSRKGQTTIYQTHA
jgi:hypothetical protein